MKEHKITPFLWFDNNAEEAIKFYLTVFKNGKLISTMPGPNGTVMGATFTLNGQTFMALNGGPQFKFNESVSFYIEVETQEEVDYYWNKLTAGGAESMCGWLKDKYGLWWQVIPSTLTKLFTDKDQGRAGRAMQAMLKMKKIDIQKLKDAADGK
jgi:predicted 3-demethylubiquinone-9 3-methyltransferase (glyoxalase superfamily)